MKIAIIEKNYSFRESLKTALNQIKDFTVVYDSNNYSDMIPISINNRIDVVLLDKTIGQTKDYEAVKLIHEKSSHSKIVMLLDYAESCFFDEVRNKGVDEVVFKYSSKELFEKSIRSVMQNRVMARER